MTYVLDTDILSLLGHKDSPQAPRIRRLLQHLATFRRITVLGYDDAAAAIAKRLREQRLRIGTMDLKIASTVLAADAILVTRNISEFRRVPDLRVEDWSSEHES